MKFNGIKKKRSFRMLSSEKLFIELNNRKTQKKKPFVFQKKIEKVDNIIFSLIYKNLKNKKIHNKKKKKKKNYKKKKIKYKDHFKIFQQ